MFGSLRDGKRRKAEWLAQSPRIVLGSCPVRDECALRRCEAT